MAARPARLARPRSLVLAGLLLLLAALLLSSDVLMRWDLRVYDLLLRLLPRPAPDHIALIAIDEESIAAIGRWPWPRSVHARLLERLTDAEVKAVGFDVLFDMADATDRDGDRAFGEAIRRSGRVVLATAPVAYGGSGLRAALPIAELSGARLGHVDIELDADGITRRVYLRAGLGEPRWPALARAMLDTGRGTDATAVSAPLPAADAPQPWARAQPYLIPFYGTAGAIPHVSYARLLRGDREQLERVRGRYVVVGVTAIGLSSNFVTPTSAHREMPGAELNANVLGGLLDGVSIRPLPPPATWLLTAFLVLAPLSIYGRTRRWHLAVFVGSLAFVVALGAGLLAFAQLWFPPVEALAVVAAGYPLWMWRRLDASLSALTLERNLARATLHAIGDAVVTAGKDGCVDYLNPVAEAMTGIRLSAARGRPVQEVVRTFDQSGAHEVPPPIDACLLQGSPLAASRYLLLRGANGERIISWTANPIRDAGGAVCGVVLAFSDVTQVLALTQEMMRQATHDGLTGLPNRALLEDRLATALARAQRAGAQVGVMFIDLDGFKKINDGLGHAAGDALLKEVAARLRSSCREADSIARWGGDEFVIVLERLLGEDAAAARAAQLIETLALPFTLGGQEVSVTTSIGVSFYPRDGKDAGSLLKRADAAMYRAKEEGRNAFRFYSSRMSARAHERLVMEKNLRDGLDHGEFLLLYQPQIEIGHGGVRGVEALLRWQRAQDSLLPPAHFLAIAEQSQLIHLLGEWVLRTAFAQLVALSGRGVRNLDMAVNLSPRQLVRRDLFDRICALLEETGADPGMVVLEVSEDLLLKEPNEVGPALQQLRDLGLRIAIDDFGAGHSSIGYLKRLPIDQLKIDRLFVRDATRNARDAALIQGMVTMARGLDLEVVAEGVENPRELELVTELGCDLAQGFFLGRPGPIQDVLPQLRGQAADVLNRQ